MNLPRPRFLAAVANEPIWPVSRPVDVTDETAFPNIAEAIRHAKQIKEKAND